MSLPMPCLSGLPRLCLPGTPARPLLALGKSLSFWWGTRRPFRTSIIYQCSGVECHINCNLSNTSLMRTEDDRSRLNDNARAIVRSRIHSLQQRSHDPAISLNGNNRAGSVLSAGHRKRDGRAGACEARGVYKLSTGENPCALAVAYKVIWAIERKDGQSYEDLIERR